MIRLKLINTVTLFTKPPSMWNYHFPLGDPCQKRNYFCFDNLFLTLFPAKLTSIFHFSILSSIFPIYLTTIVDVTTKIGPITVNRIIRLIGRITMWTNCISKTHRPMVGITESTIWNRFHDTRPCTSVILGRPLNQLQTYPWSLETPVKLSSVRTAMAPAPTAIMAATNGLLLSGLGKPNKRLFQFFIVAFLIAVLRAMNPYEELGVSSRASQEQIKKVS